MTTQNEKRLYITLALIGGAIVISKATNASGSAGSASSAADVDFRAVNSIPRGQRNNNPGNIKYSSANDWVGKIPYSENTDKTFEQFILYKFGIRAMIALLKTYISQGNNTLSKIINKWAPPSIDPTQSYINFVASQSGLNPNQILSFSYADIRSLVLEMTHFENGKTVVTKPQFDAVWNEFFGGIAGIGKIYDSNVLDLP